MHHIDTDITGAVGDGVDIESNRVDVCSSIHFAGEENLLRVTVVVATVGGE